MRACLSDAKVAPILRKHFVVVCDSSPFNKTAFGVMAFAHAPDREVISKYFVGTGNSQIGRKFLESYHNQKVAEMVKYLTDTLKKWEEMKAKR